VDDQRLFWVFMGGAVVLSALLLWLRDRSRDLRHVAEIDRKRSQQRNAVGASALTSFVCAATCSYRALRPGDPVHRVVFGLVAIVFFSAFWASIRRYRSLGKPV
jgi:hypothetical protein